MKILLFCPTYRIEPETVEAIFAQQTGNHHVDVMFTKDNPHQGDDGGMHNVLYNYQKGRRAMLDGGYDAMLCIESDIIPPADALTKLVAVEADVAYGLYAFRRGDVKNVNVLRFVVGPTPDQPLNNWPGDYKKAWGKVIPCSGCALGIVLIRRKVLEKIDFRWADTYCDGPFTNDAWSAKFSMRADMSVVCGHKTPEGVILWPTVDGVISKPGIVDGFRGILAHDPSSDGHAKLGHPTQPVELREKIPMRFIQSMAGYNADGSNLIIHPGDVRDWPVQGVGLLIEKGIAERA